MENPTRKQLFEAAQHVCYELSAASSLVGPYAAFEVLGKEEEQRASDGEVRDAHLLAVMGNATLEAMLVHARCLIEFLVRDRNTKDIHRSHFVGEWTPTSAQAKRLTADYDSICQHLSHLSWKRVETGKRYYDESGLVDDLQAVFVEFLEELSRKDEGAASWFALDAQAIAARSRTERVVSSGATTTNSILMTMARYDDPETLDFIRAAWKSLPKRERPDSD